MTEQRCRYCGGHLEQKSANRLQEYQRQWIVIENLPALICKQCGEIYYTPEAHDLVVMLLRENPTPARIESLKVYDAAHIA